MTDKEAWAAYLEIALRHSAELNRQSNSVVGVVDPDTFEKMKRATGKIMGEYYFSIIETVSDTYPDLRPDFLK